MPVFTAWGVLESTQQPGVAHASAAARASKSPIGRSAAALKHHFSMDEPPTLEPYPGFSHREDSVEQRFDPPNSARAQWLEQMTGRPSPITGLDTVPGGDLGEESSPRRGKSCPRGTSSPSQRGASKASGGGGPPSARQRGPWHQEEAAVLKSPRAPEECLPKDAGGFQGAMPAGMYYQSGASAAALEKAAVQAAGHELPSEPLQAATSLSDEHVHRVEGAVATPRHFCPPSRRPNQAQAAAMASLTGQDPRGGRSSSRPQRGERNNGNISDSIGGGTREPGPELNLDLAGFRRARAASSGFSRARSRHRQQSTRWKI